jgi:hypothetical protein
MRKGSSIANGTIRTILNGSGEDVVIKTSTTGVSSDQVNRLIAKADGKVGIGTDNPLTKLSVIGSSETYSLGTNGIAQFTTGTGISTDYKIQFGVTDATKAWIQSAGNGIPQPLVINPNNGGVGIGMQNQWDEALSISAPWLANPGLYLTNCILGIWGSSSAIVALHGARQWNVRSIPDGSFVISDEGGFATRNTFRIYPPWGSYTQGTIMFGVDQIDGVPTPTGDYQAANKLYVDTAVSNGIGALSTVYAPIAHTHDYSGVYAPLTHGHSWSQISGIPNSALNGWIYKAPGTYLDFNVGDNYGADVIIWSVDPNVAHTVNRATIFTTSDNLSIPIFQQIMVWGSAILVPVNSFSSTVGTYVGRVEYLNNYQGSCRLILGSGMRGMIKYIGDGY